MHNLPLSSNLYLEVVFPKFFLFSNVLESLPCNPSGYLIFTKLNI